MKTFDAFDRPQGWATAADAFRADFQAGHRIQIARWGGFAVLGYSELLELSRTTAADDMAPDADSMASTPNIYSLLVRSVFTKTGEEHRTERAALVAAFNAVNVQEIVASAAAASLRGPACGRDVEHEVARPLCCRVWAAILGFDARSATEFEAAVRDTAHVLSPFADPAKAEIADSAALTVRDLSRKALAHGTPFTDALRTKVGDEVAADLIAGMAFDALETFSAGIVAGLRVAAANRERLAATAQCADECLRLASPTPMTMRRTTGEVTFGDLIVPADTPLSMVWAAGNHDPAAFTDPATFNPDRRMRTLSFGMGHHACLGHAVVRAALQNLLQFVISRKAEFAGDLTGWRPFEPNASPLTISF